MDAVAALAELTERNREIERAALFAADGSPLASTPALDAPALGGDALELLDAASAASSEGAVEHVLVSLEHASVLCVRSSGRVAVAVTGPEPIAGLLVHDLRACLRNLDPVSRRRRPAKAGQEDDA
jgi:hypothetical protein